MPVWINVFLIVTSFLKTSRNTPNCSNITVRVCRGPKHHRPEHTPHNYSNKACVAVALANHTHIYQWQPYKLLFYYQDCRNLQPLATTDPDSKRWLNEPNPMKLHICPNASVWMKKTFSSRRSIQDFKKSYIQGTLLQYSSSANDINVHHPGLMLALCRSKETTIHSTLWRETWDESPRAPWD